MPTGLNLFRPSSFLRRSETQPEEKIAHSTDTARRNSRVSGLLHLVNERRLFASGSASFRSNYFWQCYAARTLATASLTVANWHDKKSPAKCECNHDVRARSSFWPQEPYPKRGPPCVASLSSCPLGRFRRS